MTSESSSWDDFVAHHGIGDTVAVTVTRQLPFLGSLIEVTGGVPGLLRGVRLEPGERVRVRIQEIDTDRHRIAVVSA